MKYFIANWKANKNQPEAERWIDAFLKLYQPKEDRAVIICPPFPFLVNLKQKISQVKNLKLGAQDVSRFEQGTYTGEVTAKTLQGLVDYTLIGHSERRKHFSDSNESIHRKISLAKKYQIEPIVCFGDKKDLLNLDSVNFVAFEPPWAISKGYEDSIRTTIKETPQNVLEVKKSLNLSSNRHFIYGGSVNPSNTPAYLKFDEIDGLLIGAASLDPVSFYKIIQA